MISKQKLFWGLNKNNFQKTYSKRYDPKPLKGIISSRGVHVIRCFPSFKDPHQKLDNRSDFSNPKNWDSHQNLMAAWWCLPIQIRFLWWYGCFPKSGYPKMDGLDDLGVPLFLETSICSHPNGWNHCIWGSCLEQQKKQYALFFKISLTNVWGGLCHKNHPNVSWSKVTKDVEWRSFFVFFVIY